MTAFKKGGLYLATIFIYYHPISISRLTDYDALVIDTALKLTVNRKLPHNSRIGLVSWWSKRHLITRQHTINKLYDCTDSCHKQPLGEVLHSVEICFVTSLLKWINWKKEKMCKCHSHRDREASVLPESNHESPKGSQGYADLRLWGRQPLADHELQTFSPRQDYL